MNDASPVPGATGGINFLQQITVLDNAIQLMPPKSTNTLPFTARIATGLSAQNFSSFLLNVQQKFRSSLKKVLPSVASDKLGAFPASTTLEVRVGKCNYTTASSKKEYSADCHTDTNWSSAENVSSYNSLCFAGKNDGKFNRKLQ
ncbi:hypothetical protein JTE90_006828 [Oedothorax gibbosus]|uniref:Uncharacterized protein n=1 Tax=Oedothorax gibbosus TaxID=931172 RepID=A0AAV6TVH0_9ARAC|nr:hypothetical protein JTE90_006828 [Oedothorax gibbosus]